MSDSGRSGGGTRGGGGGSSSGGISLLCRNLPIEIGADEVRDAFAAFGEIRDVYLPKDHYTQRAKGFGFIEFAARYIKNFLGHGTRDADVLSGANGGNASCPAFADARDADDAVRDLDGSLIGGRTVSVIHSKQTRKTPRDMARRDEVAPRMYQPYREDRRRDDWRYDRSWRDDRGSSRSYRRRSRSRSQSPRRRRHSSRDRGSSRSPGTGRGRSPVPRRRNCSRERSPAPARRSLPRRHSRSPVPRRGSRSPSGSSGRRRGSSASPSPPLSLSRSPVLRRSRDASRSASPMLRRSPDIPDSPGHSGGTNADAPADLPPTTETAVAV